MKTESTVVVSIGDHHQPKSMSNQNKVNEAVLLEITRPKMASNQKLVICATGIFVCYFYYGILQEKITRSIYGDGEKFTFTSTLVFVQCVINAIFAKIMLHTIMKQGEDPTKQIYYAACGFSYLGAMVTSTMALQHVNYPTQVIGKSCKPIPVMILGVLIGKKKYSLQKYLFVFMIVIGICLFMYKDKPSSTAVGDNTLLGMGEMLLLLSLLLDGFTGAIQDRMRAEYQPKSCHIMYSMNMWSVFVLCPVSILTGEIWDFLVFVEKYPYIIFNMLIFSLMSAVGQIFLFVVVSDFGPLVCSIITTTRKFFTVLGSVFLFGNSLIARQWLGTAFVFAGLTLDSFYGKQAPPKKA